MKLVFAAGLLVGFSLVFGCSTGGRKLTHSKYPGESDLSLPRRVFIAGKPYKLEEAKISCGNNNSQDLHQLTSKEQAGPIDTLPWHLEADGKVLVHSGPIRKGDEKIVETLLLKAKPQVLKIASVGGSVGAAIKISEMLKERKIAVSVYGQCFSSCANYIFTNAHHRIIGPGGYVGFHGNLTSLFRTYPADWRNQAEASYRTDPENKYANVEEFIVGRELELSEVFSSEKRLLGPWQRLFDLSHLYNSEIEPFGHYNGIFPTVRALKQLGWDGDIENLNLCMAQLAFSPLLVLKADSEQ